MDKAPQKNSKKTHLMQKIKGATPVRPACGNPNADQPGMLQNMGLGELGGSNIVFVRTFRWTLNAPAYPKITRWVQKVSANYKEKTMEIEAFEDGDGYVYQWIMDMMDDTKSVDFVVNHYDGCGQKMFAISYSGVEVVNHEVGLDYIKSEVVTHKIKLRYRNLKRLTK